MATRLCRGSSCSATPTQTHNNMFPPQNQGENSGSCVLPKPAGILRSRHITQPTNTHYVNVNHCGNLSSTQNKPGLVCLSASNTQAGVMSRRARHGEREIGGREVEERERERERKTERGEREKVGHLGSCHLTPNHSRPPPTHRESWLSSSTQFVSTSNTRNMYTYRASNPL